MIIFGFFSLLKKLLIPQSVKNVKLNSAKFLSLFLTDK